LTAYEKRKCFLSLCINHLLWSVQCTYLLYIYFILPVTKMQKVRFFSIQICYIHKCCSVTEFFLEQSQTCYKFVTNGSYPAVFVICEVGSSFMEMYEVIRIRNSDKFKANKRGDVAYDCNYGTYFSSRFNVWVVQISSFFGRYLYSSFFYYLKELWSFANILPNGKISGYFRFRKTIPENCVL